MAILILGGSQCPICGGIIEQGQKAVSFPPFVGNELDPLYLFHDSSFHEECFRRHPLAETVTVVLQQMNAKAAPSNRRCAVCLQPIDDPDEHFTLGHLVSDESHPLFRFNYAQFHRSCLSKWEERAYVREFLRHLQTSGEWKGESLKWVLDRL